MNRMAIAGGLAAVLIVPLFAAPAACRASHNVARPFLTIQPIMSA